MNEIQTIQNKIYEIRGQRVMLDFDLAAMYGVETRRLNEQVKRNIERFPEDFMFQLTKGELEILKSQIVTSNVVDNQDDSNWTSQIATSNFVKMGLRKPPYAFTENGVAMLSSVLRSPLAIQVNIGIMRAFTEFRRMASTLALPNTAKDIAQLRKDFEDLKLDIEDILHDQNDINESTRMQLENRPVKGLSPDSPSFPYASTQYMKSQNDPAYQRTSVQLSKYSSRKPCGNKIFLLKRFSFKKKLYLCN